jgi:hypothetical protein
MISSNNFWILLVVALLFDLFAGYLARRLDGLGYNTNFSYLLSSYNCNIEERPK